MIHDERNDHPDEGTIHAWLDDGLSAVEGARVEAHVAACESCAARVAEARGLIAGASRVLSKLDDVAVPLIRPAVVKQQDIPRSSLWGAMRVTPARASIAAMLIVAVGVFMTQRRSPVAEQAAMRFDSIAASAPAPTMHVVAVPEAPASDARAREQVATRLKEEQPARKMDRAAGNGFAAPPADSASSARGVLKDMAVSEQRVAVARKSMATQAETTSARADNARQSVAGAASAPSASPPAPVQAVVAARAAEDTKLMSAMQARVAGVAVTRLSGCYRVDEARQASARWGDVSFPFIVAFDSTGVVARLLTPTGDDTQARAVVTRNDADSLSFRLRRIGFVGSLALGGAGPTRNGFAKTERATDMEQAVSVTARPTACPAR